MKRLQLISGMIIMVYAAFLCFGAMKLSVGTPRTPGPGFLPFGYGALLFLLATIFVLKSGFKDGMSHESPKVLWSGLKWKQVPYTLAFLLGYALLLERLGFLICTWTIMIFLFWGKGIRRRSIAFFGGLGVAIVTYAVFKGLLKIRLPSGFLGI